MHPPFTVENESVVLITQGASYIAHQIIRGERWEATSRLSNLV